jgi:hypothetical protein
MLERRETFVRAAAIGLALMATSAATGAAAVRYTVDRTLGPARISGVITTNGASGILTTGDIVDWDLTLDANGDPATTARLLGPQSGGNSMVRIAGSPVSATPAGLFFDFSRPEFSLLQFATSSFSSIWQLQGASFHDELVTEPGSAWHQPQEPSEQQIAAAELESFRLGTTITRLRINDGVDDRLRLRMLFNLRACGDGMDPAAEPVTLTLSTPLGPFYPVGPDVFPIQPGELALHETNGVRSWSLTPAGRARTGIERLDIDEGEGSIVLVDRHANVPVMFFERVTVQVTIGNDQGDSAATLVEEPCESGHWRVGR